MFHVQHADDALALRGLGVFLTWRGGRPGCGAAPRCEFLPFLFFVRRLFARGCCGKTLPVCGAAATPERRAPGCCQALANLALQICARLRAGLTAGLSARASFGVRGFLLVRFFVGAADALNLLRSFSPERFCHSFFKVAGGLHK